MPNILYLDDNRVALKLMERSMEGFARVFCASSQSEAFNILEKNDISLVILDYSLEDGNGIEFARKLRRSDRYYQLPIILFSASLTKDLAYLGMRCGINQSLRKPLSGEELRHIISSQLAAPFVKTVERPFLAMACIAWENKGVYYQYSPDLDQTVSAATAAEANRKMADLLRSRFSPGEAAHEEIVGIELVYHTLDEQGSCES